MLTIYNKSIGFHRILILPNFDFLFKSSICPLGWKIGSSSNNKRSPKNIMITSIKEKEDVCFSIESVHCLRRNKRCYSSEGKNRNRDDY